MSNAPLTAADFARIYRERIAMVRRRAKQLVLHDHLADDVAQDVFLKFLKYLQTQHEVKNVGGLLYRMATQASIEKLQESKRAATMERQADVTPSQSVSQEQHMDVWRVLSRVSSDEALVACYYFVDGHSQEHIAEELGMSRRTVERRLDSFTACAQKLIGATARKDASIYQD